MGKKKETNDFRITSFCFNNEVTGSSVLVEVDGLKILMDLGGFQSQTETMEEIYKRNYSKAKIPFNELDYIIISHAHADHCALLPLASIEELGFQGKIMCTEGSQSLIALNIIDCAFVMAQECKAYNKRAKKPISPIYTMEDAERTIPMIQGYGYNDSIPLNDRVSFKFIPNGHLFGSASIYLTYVKDEYTNKHLLFTGDHFYGASKKQLRPFTREFPKDKTLKPSVVITESTYGGRYHEKNYDIEKHLEEVILKSHKAGHILFIPAFAISRSTQIAYYIKKVFEKHPELMSDENYPIYMSGKMMANAHRIIGSPRYKNEFVDEMWHEAYDLFTWSRISKIDNFQDVESKLIDNKPKIIIASSGMMHGGYSAFLAEHLIPRSNVDILFVGYQAEGTVGNALIAQSQKGAGEKKRVVIQGKEVKVKCNVLGNLTLSGHADSKQLKDLIIKQCDGRVLKKVVIIHGDEDAKEYLKNDLEHSMNMDRKEVIIIKPNNSIKG